MKCKDIKDFKMLLLEQMIFNNVKDDLKINTMSRLRFYLNMRDIENKVNRTRLYARLTKYRIKVYGTSTFNIERNNRERYCYILNVYE